MVLVRILKRKDASSVMIAVVLALIISSYLPSVLFELTNKLSGIDDSTYGAPVGDWKTIYLQPTILLLLQVVLLELFARVFIFLRSAWISQR
jgi:hypothetical protein